MSSIFKDIITRQEVEQAAMITLQTWLDTYLAEVERQKGLAVRSLPRPRSWMRRNEFEHWPEDQIPSIIVISPGIAEPPTGTGSGAFRANWLLGVAVVAEGQQTNNTRDLVGYYTAAIRALIIQRPSLGGFAMGVTWTDERYDDISDTEIGRTLASGQVVFQVTVENIVSTKAGPLTPDTPPVDPPDTSPTWPIADTVSVEYELEDLNGS
jgi:hypothetical protein